MRLQAYAKPLLLQWFSCLPDHLVIMLVVGSVLGSAIETLQLIRSMLRLMLERLLSSLTLMLTTVTVQRKRYNLVIMVSIVLYTRLVRIFTQVQGSNQVKGV